MAKIFNIRILLAFLLQFEMILVNADPEADPVPVPEAESQADPQNRYPWSYSSGLYGSSISNSQPSYSRSPCEMANDCCGMDSQNCCFKGGQQRCYTVWDKLCDTEDQAECQLRVDRHCHDIQVRECRVITDVTYKTFPITSCFQRPLTKCFEYEKKICSSSLEPKMQTVNWVNQKLTLLKEDEKTHCFDQTTVDCDTEYIPEVVTEQKRKERKNVEYQKKCRMVQKREPDQQTTVPVTRITYKTMCYDIPRSACSQTPCRMTGTCTGNTNVCSTTETTTNTVCPQVIDQSVAAPGRTSCQQIQQPLCSDSPYCRPAQDQCCSTSVQRVCRQVPQRTVEQVPQVIPGAIKWDEVCEDVPIERVEYYYEPVEKVVNRTKENCKQVVKEQCHNYTVPVFGVANETKVDEILVTLPSCHHTTVKDRYCHTFPDGDIGCKNTSIRKGFRINKVICDKVVTKKECFNIPIAECRIGSRPNCRWVPRQVCQDTCSNSRYCQQCDNFRNGPGFESCSAGTCGIYYPNDESVPLSGNNWIAGKFRSEEVSPDIEEQDGYESDTYWNEQDFQVGGVQEISLKETLPLDKGLSD